MRTNAAAMASTGALHRSQKSLAKSLNRLAEGRRVIGAADDAAGLGVSVNLDTQSSSLRVATRNANDGISLIQVAESATETTTNLLQRMRELAVQSSSETLDNDERAYLQSEYAEYVDQIRVISRETEFNGINLTDALTPTVDVQVGSGRGTDNRITLNMPNLRGVWNAVRTESLATVTGAQDAIDAVDTAIDLTSEARSVLGAGHNRLLHALASAETSITALSSASSQIMDLDFALETSTLTRNQVLQQAAVASSVQATDISSSVLSLL